MLARTAICLGRRCNCVFAEVKVLCLKELQSCVCMGCNIAFAGTVMFCLQELQCRCCSSCNVLFAGAAMFCFTWRLYPLPIETCT